MSDAKDQRLIETYRAAGGELPPPALDRAILESARHAVAAQQSAHPAALHRSRWLRPLALAASVVLGLGIVIRVQMERPDLTPPVAQPAAPAAAVAPPAEAPASAQPAPAQDAAPAVNLPIAKKGPAPAPAKQKEAVQSYAGKAAKLDQAPGLSRPSAVVEEAEKREASRREGAAGAAGAQYESAQRSRLSGAGANMGFRGTDDAAAPQATDKAARRDDSPVAGALGGNLSKDSSHAEAQSRNAPATNVGQAQQPAPQEMAPPQAAPAPVPPASIMAAPPPPPPPPAMSASPNAALGFSAPAKPIAPAQQPEPADAKVADGTAAASGAPRDAAARFRTQSASTVRPLDESNPAAWAKRIGELRRAGRALEADAELKRLRERYPDFKVPAEALPPPPASASPARPP